MKNWIFYKITNPVGGVYVGRTSNFKGRVSNYKNLSKSIVGQRLLYNSLVEYGFECHKIEIIEKSSLSIVDAESKEMFWIRTYMCNRNKWPEFDKWGYW